MINHIKVLGLIGLTLVLPSIAAADPNANSVAEIRACRPAGTQTAQVCSTKELSNVIVRCNVGGSASSFVKFDNLHAFRAPHQGADFSLASPYQGDFSCPAGSTIVAVFVKSGSEKYSGPAIANLPRGSGAIISNLGTCSAVCTAGPGGGNLGGN